MALEWAFLKTPIGVKIGLTRNLFFQVSADYYRTPFQAFLEILNFWLLEIFLPNL